MPLSKVKMIVALAGRSYTLQAGEIVALPPEVAERYVAKNLAEYVEEPEGVKPSGPPVKSARKASSRKAKTNQKR